MNTEKRLKGRKDETESASCCTQQCCCWYTSFIINPSTLFVVLVTVHVLSEFMYYQSLVRSSPTIEDQPDYLNSLYVFLIFAAVGLIVFVVGFCVMGSGYAGFIGLLLAVLGSAVQSSLLTDYFMNKYPDDIIAVPVVYERGIKKRCRSPDGVSEYCGYELTR